MSLETESNTKSALSGCIYCLLSAHMRSFPLIDGLLDASGVTNTSVVAKHLDATDFHWSKHVDLNY